MCPVGLKGSETGPFLDDLVSKNRSHVETYWNSFNELEGPGGPESNRSTLYPYIMGIRLYRIRTTKKR